MHAIVKAVPLGEWDKERHRILKRWIEEHTQEINRMQERLVADHAPERWGSSFPYLDDRAEIVDGILVFSRSSLR